MSTIGFHALEPGGPGLAANSGTGVFVSALLALLQSEPGIDVSVRWYDHIATHPPEELGELLRAAGRGLGQAGRLVGDTSRQLVVVYPVAPLFTGAGIAPLPALARRVYRALQLRKRLSRRRLNVIVKDLPLDRDAGRARALGTPQHPDDPAVRHLESVIFRTADRLVLPEGLRDFVCERYGIDVRRCRTFRRYPYPAEAKSTAEPPLEFESGGVNFFYSGSVDPEVAPNFREILRSIRNAPATRLHVCGPERDAVRQWLAELDVPNVRHYGQLAVAQHDWLAQRCDVGLILDPTDNPYRNLVPSLKYSAYLANGLAVLSTDLRQVAASLREDGTGTAMPIRELALELLRWATRKPLWAEARERARARAMAVRSGADLQSWIAELSRAD